MEYNLEFSFPFKSCQEMASQKRRKRATFVVAEMRSKCRIRGDAIKTDIRKIRSQQRIRGRGARNMDKTQISIYQNVGTPKSSANTRSKGN